jgi:ADP-specific Phosphofructokinase/Glucokinase conserved region
MSTAGWQRRYAELAERLPDVVRRARPVLCGLGVCIDAYVRLEAIVNVLDDAAGPAAGELRKRLIERAGHGIGGEIRVDWQEGPAWLGVRLRPPFGLGGTGAQAAQTLAVLGAPTLLALSDRSAAQIALIHPEVRVAGPEGDVPVRMIESSAGHSKPPHYIIEFTAGAPVAGVVPPRSSRVIVCFDPDPLEPDPWFAPASVELAATAGAAILSGFNELPEGVLPEVLAWVRPLADAWRAARVPWIHLELGDFPHPAGMQEVLLGLAGSCTSLGLSQSELVQLVREDGSVADRALSLAERFALDRVAVHADRFALALTRGDPELELEALMTGSLLAATRAWRGQIAVPAGCPSDAEFSEPPGPAISRRGDWHVVCCATPYLPRPAATIGLGDTFLAGTLLVLSQPAGQRSTIPSRLKETTV